MSGRRPTTAKVGETVALTPSLVTMHRVLAAGRLAALSRRPPLRRRGSNPTASLAEQTASLRHLLRTLRPLLQLPRLPLLSSSRFSTRAAKEPYAVLGLPQDASAEQVKRAYYQLALTLHPDRHPDSPDAVERFTEVGAAYTTILGDESLDTEERRKAKATAGQPAEMPDEVAFTKVPPPKLTCNPACPGCNPTCPGRSPMCPGCSPTCPGRSPMRPSCSHMYSGAARRRLPELGGPAGELAAPPRRRAARRMADALLLAHHLPACAAAC